MISHRVVIALGSNLGDREENISLALELLRECLSIEKFSTLVETDPVGGPIQDKYLNAVAIASTTLDPESLLAQFHKIERDLGRLRIEINGPRTIDIDLIAYDDLEISNEIVTIPHPRAHLRQFVLAPWFEIEPAGSIPGKGAISELLRQLK
jgi:2-amino-4-hydroxy-6-hydroxymethyldihydropteridine diphosphokinase